jgi:hypothetical protein
MFDDGEFPQTWVQELRVKFIKRFTVFKTVNRFSKIKEVFLVKLKIIFVDHHFLLN